MDAPRYHPVSIALHWLIVLFVLAQLALGWWMIDIPKSPPGPRAWWFNLHKSIGLTIGVLMLARLGWRLSHAAPPLPTRCRAGSATLRTRATSCSMPA
jgi:cytochrome b561